MDWISVDERLPAEGEKVKLAIRYTYNHDTEQRAFLQGFTFLDGKWKLTEHDTSGNIQSWAELFKECTVTHWMPYPAPASD